MQRQSTKAFPYPAPVLECPTPVICAGPVASLRDRLLFRVSMVANNPKVKIPRRARWCRPPSLPRSVKLHCCSRGPAGAVDPASQTFNDPDFAHRFGIAVVVSVSPLFNRYSPNYSRPDEDLCSGEQHGPSWVE
jgi:hypothetical protein